MEVHEFYRCLEEHCEKSDCGSCELAGYCDMIGCGSICMVDKAIDVLRREGIAAVEPAMPSVPVTDMTPTELRESLIEMLHRRTSKIIDEAEVNPVTENRIAANVTMLSDMIEDMEASRKGRDVDAVEDVLDRIDYRVGASKVRVSSEEIDISSPKATVSAPDKPLSEHTEEELIKELVRRELPRVAKNGLRDFEVKYQITLRNPDGMQYQIYKGQRAGG